MNTQRNQAMMTRWLAVVLALILLLWSACAREKARVEQPFIEAIARGDIELVKNLLEKGADANQRAQDARTALMYSTDAGDHDLAKLLIEAGADVNAKDHAGATALMAAAALGLPKILHLLIEKGADVNAVTEEGATALMFAANGGYLLETRLLLENGADINSRRKDGATALVGAIAGGGNPEVIKLLVEYKADVNIPAAFGVTPLRLAEIYGQTEVVRLLKAHGAQ